MFLARLGPYRPHLSVTDSSLSCSSTRHLFREQVHMPEARFIGVYCASAAQEVSALLLTYPRLAPFLKLYRQEGGRVHV